MKPLENPAWESFARFCAAGKSKKESAIAAGFSGKSSSAAGSKLAKIAKVKARIEYLQSQAAEKTVAKVAKLADLSIATKINRIEEQNHRWELLKQIRHERANDPTLAKIPGGKTGFIVRTIKAVGSGSGMKVVPAYEVDYGLLRELRAHEEQVEKSLGQIVERRELKLNVKELSDAELEELVNEFDSGESR